VRRLGANAAQSKGLATTETEADPYGMTNQKTRQKDGQEDSVKTG
jgi:hypothetical protein